MIELITALEKISERIYEEYQKLYDLENKGLNKLSILDQERIIETLKKLKSIEDDIIEKLKERKELKKASAYLKNKYDKDSDSIYIDITQDKSGLLTHRVYNRIIYELVKEESKSDYCVLNSDIVEEFIISDYLLLSMTILEKTLPNCYKSEIYKIKYKLSLTIPDLETTLINTQFKTSKHPYVTHKLLITNELSKKFVTTYVEERLMTDINVRLNLLATLNVEYIESNDEVFAAVIYLLSTIRAALLLMDELDLDDFNKSIYIMIKKIANNFTKEYNRRILYNFAEDMQNDKSIPQILKLFK